MFKDFTGLEYVKIDIANHFGLDKIPFEERIQWVDDHKDDLEELLVEADKKFLYWKGVRALRDAYNFKSTGHVVGLDACASGVQIMGTLMNCRATCSQVGLIDPDRRMDLYTEGLANINKLLLDKHKVDMDGEKVTRDMVKDAIMTYFYGSVMQPKLLFGEDTPAYKAFFIALKDMCPGAVTLRKVLLDAWPKDRNYYEWTLPDGFHARIKVMNSYTKKVEVDELGGKKFSHTFEDNVVMRRGKSTAANTIHSIDGMIVREINRRCNYSEALLDSALTVLDNAGIQSYAEKDMHNDFITLRHVNKLFGKRLPRDVDLSALKSLIEKTLSRRSFEVLATHDCFKCHPNHMNTLRRTYNEIMAELSQSNFMEGVLKQLYRREVRMGSKDIELKNIILASNYGLS